MLKLVQQTIPSMLRHMKGHTETIFFHLNAGPLINTRTVLKYRVRSFGMIRNEISDPRSLGSPCIKGAGKSLFRADSPAPLMHSDPSDLGSLILIWIISKERTHNLCWVRQVYLAEF